MQWHLTLAHPDRALFPSEAHRLRAVRVLVRMVGPPLILFDAAVRKWVALRDAAHSYERATP